MRKREWTSGCLSAEEVHTGYCSQQDFTCKHPLTDKPTHKQTHTKAYSNDWILDACFTKKKLNNYRQIKVDVKQINVAMCTQTFQSCNVENEMQVMHPSV